MSDHQQNAWIQIVGREDKYTVVDTGRLWNITRALPSPDTQAPSTCFFLGQKHKDNALRCLFPQNNIRRAKQPGLARMRLANETVRSERPFLFADADLSLDIPDRQSYTKTSEEKHFPIHWQHPDVRDVVDHIFARVICATSNIVVTFVDDFKCWRTLTSDFLRWIEIGIRSDTPVECRPRLLLVIGGRIQENRQKIWTLYKDLERKSSKRVSNLFSCVTTQYLEEGELSDVALYRPLKEEILRQTDQIRSALIEAKWLFSADHLASLTTIRLTRVADDARATLPTIQATRPYHESPSRYTEHIAAFVRASLKKAIPYEMMTSHIASALLLDAFPPGAHLFQPGTVFSELYFAPCAAALNLHFPQEVGDFLLNQILRRFNQHSEYRAVGKASSMELHTANIRTQGSKWRTLFSCGTCLICIGRAPQQCFPCGHTLCDVCVSQLGAALLGEEYCYEHKICLLCQHSETCIFRLRPPTSGVRAITVDGGGIRGVMPLEVAILLQGILGPALDIHDFFDYAAGTSSGGLIVLAIFLFGWSPQKSSEVFEKALHDLFGRPKGQRSALTAKVMKAVRCWATDSRYDNAKVQSTLKDVFGSSQRIFGHFPKPINGGKVAVTATSISNADCFLFTNYNDSSTTDFPSGYRVLPQDDEKEPTMVWQAAQATTAAPVYFQPARLPSHGSFQDGALYDNNPVDLALSECNRLWPTNGSPDIVLSLGTGTTECASPKAPLFRDVLTDGFLPRLQRYFARSFYGQKTWNTLQDRLDNTSRQHYHRLNVTLDTVPDIDDVGSMPRLRNSVHFQPDGARVRIELVGALLTASFFFELNALPEHCNGAYRCEGRIRLRNHSYGVVQALARIMTGEVVFMNDDGYLATFDGIQSICSQCNRFRKSVIFHVTDLRSPVAIYLKGTGTPKSRISGFPNSMKWFIDQQKLDAAFGVPDEIPRAECGACPNGVPKRKATAPVAELFPRKRRRRPEKATSDSKITIPLESSFI